MKSGRPISVLRITPQARAELERRVQAGTTPQRDCIRARIVLLRANGMKQEDVGREAGLSTTSVNKWSQRFARHGLEGPTGARPQLIDPIGENGTGGHTGRASATGTPALEFAHDGGGGGGLGVERAAYLAAQRPRAPSAPDLQALERQAVRGEILGCHRSVPESTGQSLGVAMRRLGVKHWNARSQGFHQASATSGLARMTISAMGRSRCSLL